MRIAITGTPGVGKSEVSRALSKRMKYELVRVNDLAEKLNAYRGYDERRESKILDMGKLREEVQKLKGNFIVEGHVSHEFPVDVVIVLRCDPMTLKERLDKRYPKNPFKVQENVEAEKLGVITSEALMHNERVYEVDTTGKKVRETVDDVLRILRGETEGFEVGKIDWLVE